MKVSLDKIFTTITATPFQKGNYVEIEPSGVLKPYIRCFWGCEHSQGDISELEGKSSLIIPDICMDIILSQDSHNIRSGFCGINNGSFLSKESGGKIFGIRFYAWSAVLFADGGMNGVLNKFANIEEYFPDFSYSLKAEIMGVDSIYKRKEIAEKYLLGRLNGSRINCDVMNSLYYIITCNAKATVSDLSYYCALSKRQLERSFLENTGVSPKQMINLIRYQLLWQDCIKQNFDAGNCVEKFGYYDQSHMLREFKKYHSIPLGQARNELVRMSHFYNTR